MFKDKLDWNYWSDDLEMGIASIDDDHRRILALIGTLRDAIDSPDPHPVIIATLATLRDYADRHFRREEAMLATSGYPNLTSHRQVHDSFRDYTRHPSEDDALPNAVLMLSYLVNWWTGHIVTDDKQYRDHVLRHPEAIAAAEAFPPILPED